MVIESPAKTGFLLHCNFVQRHVLSILLIISGLVLALKVKLVSLLPLYAISPSCISNGGAAKRVVELKKNRNSREFFIIFVKICIC